MKKLLIYTLLLGSSFIFKLHACSYYPYREAIRFCFTHSLNLNMLEFSEFDYSTHRFYSNNDIEDTGNIDAWFEHCNKKVTKQAIKEAIYVIPFYDFNKASPNTMIQYLYKQNDTETIAYIKFAKNCEAFNKSYEDPWERNESKGINERAKIIKTAIQKIEQTANSALKRRYAFLAIRLAHYNNNKEEIIHLFNSVITKSSTKDILYYWSLYFRAKAEKNNDLQSYYAAQVFANSAEKRFPIFYNFDFKLSIDKILKHAKNNTEKANIYAIKGIKEHGKALKYMQKVATLNTTNKLLPFLVLREINKLEDWILTPYFSLFDPSLSETNTHYLREDFSYTTIQKRIKKDRVYAEKITFFIQSLPKAIQEKTVWRVLKIQLHYLTQNYNKALHEITALKDTKNIKKELQEQLEKTKALCSIALQKNGNASLNSTLKKVILTYKKDQQFVFAIARELEYKGNKTEAALLYAALPEYNNEYLDTGVYWKSKKNKKSSYYDYFDNYFEYANVMYSVDEIELLISNILTNKDKQDAFSVWKYRFIKKDIPKLYDLVGTMYIRKNNLEKALFFFNKIDNTYWDKTNYLWGKIYDDTKFSNHGKEHKDKVRDYQNPFYKLNHATRFITEKETFELNKKTVTAKLIEYIEKTKTAKNKDYYYFLVANCYYNMTIYGNAWMMRRFGVSSYDTEPYPEDEPEFRRGTLAKKYYTLAFENATNDKFRALCLKMIGKCEYFEKIDSRNSSKNSSLFKINTAYKKLKDLNENYYEELRHCGWFENYFKPSSEK